MVTIKQIAERAEISEEDVRAALCIGWNAPLLAAAAGISGQYVRRMLRQGNIKGANPGGMGWMISKQAGDAWLASRGVSVVE